MTADNGVTSVEQIYQERSDRFGQQAAYFGRHEGRLILARGLTFLAGAGCFLMACLDENMRVVWITAGTLLIVAFLAFAVLDDWMKRNREHLLQLQQVNDWQLARKRRCWSGIPIPVVTIPTPYAAVAKDLDLFGQASLFQLLCLAHTPRGMAILRDWILEPASPEEVAARQQAVTGTHTGTGTARGTGAARAYAGTQSGRPGGICQVG